MIKLLHRDSCECGKEFGTDGNLIPNIKDREFYGGRVNFFKEVKCDCGKEYVLCIEKQYSSLDGFGLKIIDIADVTDENPFETFKGMVRPKVKEEKEQIDTSERTLTTLVERERQLDILKRLTMKELQNLMKLNKLKFKVTESKMALISRLLEANPNVVEAKET